VTTYLTTIASRTLGAAPLLSPLTRSRFEAPAAAFEGKIDQSEPGLEDTPQAAEPAPPRDSGSGGEGHLIAGERRGPEPALLARPQPSIAEELRPRQLLRPTPKVEDPFAAVGPEQAATSTVEPVQPRPSAERSTSTPDRAAPRGPDRTRGSGWGKQRARGQGWPTRERVRVVDSSRVAPPPAQPGQRPEPLSADFEAGPATVVVRIGRIDVRAVHAPPVATPARPPSPTGVSLADHLRARDRGRR
jgi:hypothetical protein